MTADARVARWVDVVSDLLMKPLTVFPHAQIAAELRNTFEITALSWNWRDADGTFGYQLFPFIHEMFTSEARDVWDSGEMLDKHPLVRWFATTGETDAQSIGRVPIAIAGRRERAQVVDLLEPFECEEQISIPYQLDGLHHRAFVLARSGDDFCAEDLEVAQRLQPLIRALSTQTHLLSGRDFDPTTSVSAASLGLTGRELAVLQLLAEGYTAYGAARRLGISPRTVQKHLEHIYRKLSVSDRLSAVQVAVEIGLVDTDRLSVAARGDLRRPEFPEQRPAADA
jgi:DNA-binding CsgD family transcriptional regulator